MTKVTANSKVKFHYTGKLTTGEIFDSSADREPLEVQLGQGMLIPGLESRITEMEVNEKRTVNIPFAEAYGEEKQELFQPVGKEQLPGDMEPEVGMGLVASHPDGSQQQLIIAEVNDDHVIINANHPLAGKDLVFDIEMIEIS